MKSDSQMEEKREEEKKTGKKEGRKDEWYLRLRNIKRKKKSCTWGRKSYETCIVLQITKTA